LRNEFLRRFERKQFDTCDIEEIDSPAATGLGLDDMMAVRQALASAPRSLSEPLVMQVLGGFSAEELAQLNETTTGAITTRMSRARQWLRARLSGDNPGAHAYPSKGGEFQ
jgi:RNA polymerase sigma-70 factor (ECF subfamily)